jgi:putative spermidine/putrescine transport system permease protein
LAAEAVIAAAGAPKAGPADLRQAMVRAQRKRNLWAMALIAPLLVFLVINFLAPITLMLTRSVEDRELSTAWPQTAAAIRQWDGKGLPDEAALRTFTRELKASKDDGSLSTVANRLNYDVSGFRSLLFSTSRQVPLAEGKPAIAGLVAIDPRWGQRETWAAIRHAAGPATSFYLLASLDRRLNADGQVARVPAERAVFVQVFLRTFWISAMTALFCVLLGYPLAYLLANTPARISNLLMILVLLPFWTSILVRSTAWVVLLQTHGLVNDALMGLGLIRHPLELVYNRVGVYVAMTHVLMPFFVLPLYGVMKGVQPHAMRAALSLGAHPARAFWRVYLPQTLPGVLAGSLIVFILALGYYVTPALVGGAGDQLISFFIAFYTNQSLNWGMAAALSLVLLAITVVLTAVYGRLLGRRGLEWR